jgi:cation transport regulator ChaC
MKSHWYFAYGSNMNPARLVQARLWPAGATCFERILGRLDGWELVFDKPSAYFIGAGAANLAVSPSAHVLGVLNRISANGIEAIDRYENVATGHYERISIRVARSDGSEVEAQTYIARNNLDRGLKPRAAYLAHLLAGDDVLPAAYVAALRRVAVCEEVDAAT